MPNDPNHAKPPTGYHPACGADPGPKVWIPPVAFVVLLTALAATSFYNYLLFHTIVELVAVGIAIAVFTVAWNAWEMRENIYLIVIGTGLLCVAGIGLVHTLAYDGMGIFVGYDANLPTQLWIASRYLLAGTLLVAPLLIEKGPGPRKILVGFTGITIALLLSIFAFPIFPDCYIEGSGLTTFKIVSEYVISALLVLGAIAFYRVRTTFSPLVSRYLIAAILVLIPSELAFTLYVSVYGIENMIGHLLMVLSYGLFYVAFVEFGIRQPCAVVFTDLARSERQLRREKDRLGQYLDIAGALFVALDRDGRITLINRRTSEILGCSEEEVMGELWADRFIPAREREHFHTLFTGLIQGDIESGEFERTAALTAEGDERIIEWNNTTIQDMDGTIIGTLSSGKDITEQQLAEEALNKANEKLNLLSAITRHDILNQITIARAYIDFSIEDTNTPGTLDYLKRAQSAVDEIQKQIEFTRNYQDMGVKRPVWQRPEELILESAAELALLAEIQVDLAGLEIYADPMVKKVFYNLIDNAARHGKNITEIRISRARAGQDLLILCEDDGIGIPDEEKEAIFRATYRRRHGHGLFLVAEILGITGMSIRETGVPGEGARFEIRVPNGGWRDAGAPGMGGSSTSIPDRPAEQSSSDPVHR
ncbi:MAG: PAS domain S-box protein [Methanomicrobiales archaeon]|jgi:PAS domain S-box-containing protein|nr:PAS domain S-box protein [Methanomicrobiales archaeon]